MILPRVAHASGEFAQPVALIIEDDQDTIDLLETVLSQAGFSVLSATNAADGIALAQEHQPVLATIDVTMPGMDGLEATRRIREFSDAYIVIVSSRSQETDILAGFDAGADDYVPKPIRPRELTARLSAVARRPLSAEAAWSPAPADPDRSEYLRLVQSGEAETDDGQDGQDGRDGMIEVGMRFVGNWIDFRGLRINPARDIVVVDDRFVDLPPEQVRLIETLLYCGSRTLNGRQIALRLRGETEMTARTTADQDQRWVDAQMASLRSRLEDDGPDPRWIEELPRGRYRLVRSAPEPAPL